MAKELNHVWDVRFSLLYGDVDSKIKNINLYRYEAGLGIQNNLNYIGEQLNLSVDFTFSIIDAIKGYKDPYRKWQWYLKAGMGGIVMLPDADRHETDGGTDMWLGNLSYSANAGMGVSWRIIDLLSVFIEPTIYSPLDFPQIEKFDWVGQYLYIPVGVEFHLGVTPEDRARIAEEKMLTKERFDSLANENENDKEELAKAKKNEQDLKNKIAALEDQNGQLKDKLDQTEADNDRMRNSLKNIKDNQQNLYGMPLSILYPNDVWKVPADQMNKLKAVAQVMKDNENTKFTIIGYCDEPASYEYNDKLSEKRAKEVKRLLVEKYGIDENRLNTEWKGKRECFGDCKFSINRRSSFYVNMDEE